LETYLARLDVDREASPELPVECAPAEVVEEFIKKAPGEIQGLLLALIHCNVFGFALQDRPLQAASVNCLTSIGLLAEEAVGLAILFITASSGIIISQVVRGPLVHNHFTI
jgi:hypothetical protein